MSLFLSRVLSLSFCHSSLIVGQGIPSPLIPPPFLGQRPAETGEPVTYPLSSPSFPCLFWLQCLTTCSSTAKFLEQRKDKDELSARGDKEA
ncbi:hypothetical protein LY78DRAFT_663373, partial [Colletotrichum sublineola]